MCNVIKFDKDYKRPNTKCYYLVIKDKMIKFDSFESAMNSISFNGEIEPIYKVPYTRIYASYGSGINEMLYCLWSGDT